MLFLWHNAAKSNFFFLQLNCGRFMENGNCGYVLRPECMFKEGFAPTNADQIGATTTTAR